MTWKQSFSLDALNRTSTSTLAENLGIEYVDFGADFITARMPVDDRTVQPMRLLHGGANAALAETLGSVAGLMCLEDIETQSIVGIEINCSHLRSATEGFVYGTVKPIRIGRRLQVWNIDIQNEAGKLICVSRLTIMVVQR